MSLSRIYQATSLVINQSFRLDDKASHHLARVLRAKVGDELVVFNGEGGEFRAHITHIDKKGVDVNLSHFDMREVESPVKILLAQGIARGEKMDFIVQKAVELGASGIIPLVTERCNVRLDQEREEKRLQHWQSVVISACEQSGRNRIPTVSAPQSLKTWLPSVQADQRFVLSPHVENRLPTPSLAAGATIVLLIGPEGGLSDQEVELSLKHQFVPILLGPRVMRTETASLAALTILQSIYGDMR